MSSSTVQQTKQLTPERHRHVACNLAAYDLTWYGLKGCKAPSFVISQIHDAMQLALSALLLDEECRTWLIANVLNPLNARTVEEAYAVHIEGLAAE